MSDFDEKNLTPFSLEGKAFLNEVFTSVLEKEKQGSTFSIEEAEGIVSRLMVMPPEDLKPILVALVSGDDYRDHMAARDLFVILGCYRSLYLRFLYCTDREKWEEEMKKDANSKNP